MRKYNLTIAGGGSTYTPGIVNSILNAADVLPLNKLVLLDTDEERVSLMGGFISLLIKQRAPDVDVVITTDRKEAFTNMDFLFAQIRSGGLKMRIQDEQIPLKFGVVGQETCGPGGFAFALRSIPDMLEIGEDVRHYAPDAWILNYSNPAAILADMWNKRFPELKSLFICDMPIVIELLVSATLGYKHEQLNFDYFGLNHFGWWRHIWSPDGEDLLPKLRDHMLSDKPLTLYEDDHVNEDWISTFERLRKSMRMFPEFLSSTYMQYYYFGEEMRGHCKPDYTRANRVIDTREKDVFAECQRCVDVGTVEGSFLTSGVHGDFIVNHAKAILTNTPMRTTVNIPNKGAINGLPDDAIVEVHGIVSAHGIEHFTTGTIPHFQRALMVQQNAYEQLTVEAALEGSYKKALQALTLNRTVPSADVAQKILDEFIDVNKGYWPLLR
ncbi:6-phospho-alpha-glucosidase [Salmonella enterica]|nr:6-phospho-alpha-glucosidase [Salmonella enterica]ECD0159047.1 6-phospho-alpha-glucosidase [Salmonella enterica subsp. enterica]ECD4440919.1 6-phospho-alpha-glucosidase [Salmonella enterica subsp. enterica serovar Florida]ECH9650089.1 6-phospho-alpha-glucosidase [Salmonella enterica subsp. enterica serovar Miami]ECX3451805.1 6-phospho-alpha-glucosidase [Salmonella enterica subsp. enterica serovar Rubislaw]EDN5013236.1 6-phospho-alpha-glucosidase [Salmonella enterica subsp. enterica serovar J